MSLWQCTLWIETFDSESWVILLCLLLTYFSLRNMSRLFYEAWRNLGSFACFHEASLCEPLSMRGLHRVCSCILRGCPLGHEIWVRLKIPQFLYMLIWILLDTLPGETLWVRTILLPHDWFLSTLKYSWIIDLTTLSNHRFLWFILRRRTIAYDFLSDSTFM